MSLRLLTVISAVVAIFICTHVSAMAQPVHIVCIGDSITQGRGNTAADGKARQPTQGWRYAFWKQCIESGVNIEMVGSIDSGFESTPDYPEYKGFAFNNRHEARWGWTTEAVKDKVKETQSGWTADVALIYLGTNKEKPADGKPDPSDPAGVARTSKAMRELVMLLRTNNPRMAIIIRCLHAHDTRTQGLQSEYRKIAAELSTPEAPILTVDQSPGWQWNPQLPGADTVDGCHPNPQGDSKIAHDMYEAFESVIKFTAKP